MKSGDTFFLNHSLAHRHLWVVAGGPDANGEFVIFNFTSLQDQCDTTCVLDKGDHPRIEHPTYVTYLRGRTVTPGFLKQMGPLCSWQDPVSAEVLNRVQHGALASQFTKSKHQQIVRASM